MFSWEFCETFKNTYFYETTVVAASNKSRFQINFLEKAQYNINRKANLE